MTVLGFDSITMGYAYSQGVPESILGILLAVGAAVGLLGSVFFPFLVRCMGVERTGDFSDKFMLSCILELFPRIRFNF
jgi:iron-regulated transporter 1